MVITVPKIITKNPIAIESHDHLVPHGTMRDNTKNGAYCRELIRMFGQDIKYLDLGCAGGGFVAQMVQTYAAFAVGVDGSDYCLKNKRAEWTNIPGNLFTCDIAKPFHFIDQYGNQIWFDVISCFDVLEHIEKADLDNVVSNIINNLRVGGIFVASIAMFEDPGYRVTLESKEWWDDLFIKSGFVVDAPLQNFGRNSSYDVVYKKV